MADLEQDGKQEDSLKKLTSWVKQDGKSAVKLNGYPATIASAKKLGWKLKGSK